MTLKELSQLYYLNREIEMDKKRLQELEVLAVSISPNLTGMPRSPGVSDKVGRYAAEIADLKGIIETLQRQMERQFMENFRLMQQYFAETFAKLFGGGHAELRLLDENDVLGCGIEIVAQPPGKKLQLLSLLSGGERALTAIAILFAMLRLKPTPFCFLDEIEAALDDGNISTFADYLREFSTDTQFVVVTHRKGTMERCDSLYGVAMEEKGVSTMLSVELKDVDADAMA